MYTSVLCSDEIYKLHEYLKILFSSKTDPMNFCKIKSEKFVGIISTKIKIFKQLIIDGKICVYKGINPNIFCVKVLGNADQYEYEYPECLGIPKKCVYLYIPIISDDKNISLKTDDISSYYIAPKCAYLSKDVSLVNQKTSDDRYFIVCTLIYE